MLQYTRKGRATVFDLTQKSDPESSADTHVWRTVGSTTLTTKHKEDLESSNWLDDKLMHAAQQLLQQQHPHVRGLQDTIQQLTHTFDVHTGEFVQCLCLGSVHWITVSTIGCLPSVVHVYESMNMPLSSSVKKIMAELMHTEGRQIVFEHMNVQQQKGSSDCGLFAIANATTLCHGENPVTFEYNQKAMRAHLLKAIELKVLVPFPAVKTNKRMKRECLHRERLRVYCACRLADDGRKMMQCSSCKESYHFNCVSVPKKVLKRSNDPWFCNSCKQ